MSAARLALLNSYPASVVKAGWRGDSVNRPVASCFQHPCPSHAPEALIRHLIAASRPMHFAHLPSDGPPIVPVAKRDQYSSPAHPTGTDEGGGRVFRARRILAKGRPALHRGAQFGPCVALRAPERHVRGSIGTRPDPPCANCLAVRSGCLSIAAAQSVLTFRATPVLRKDTAIGGGNSDAANSVPPPSNNADQKREGQFVSFELCRHLFFGGERQFSPLRLPVDAQRDFANGTLVLIKLALTTHVFCREAP